MDKDKRAEQILRKKGRKAQKRLDVALSQQFNPRFLEDADSRIAVVRTLRKRVEILQAHELKKFGLRRVVGDNYAAEFVAQSFKACGIHYAKSDRPKSQLYKELLPRLCSAEIELLDDERI